MARSTCGSNTRHRGLLLLWPGLLVDLRRGDASRKPALGAAREHERPGTRPRWHRPHGNPFRPSETPPDGYSPRARPADRGDGPVSDPRTRFPPQPIDSIILIALACFLGIGSRRYAHSLPEFIPSTSGRRSGHRWHRCLDLWRPDPGVRPTTTAAAVADLGAGADALSVGTLTGPHDPHQFRDRTAPDRRAEEPDGGPGSDGARRVPDPPDGDSRGHPESIEGRMTNPREP